jgi:hypothetical protein
MAGVNETAELVLQRLRQIMNRWPRPGDGQGVKVAAVIDGLRPLTPLAEMVLRLPVGYAKGYYQGAGYLSGSYQLTEADRAVAHAVLNDAKVDLPPAAGQALTRTGYAKIKERAYRLLLLAADLDTTVGQLAKVGTASTAAWDTWISLAPVVDLVPAVASGAAGIPGPIAKVIAVLTHKLTLHKMPPDAVGYFPDDRQVIFGYVDPAMAVTADDLLPQSLEIDARIIRFKATADRTYVSGAVGVNNKAEAALRRFENFMNAFPRPGVNQIVRFEALIKALKQLEPLAERVAALPEGSPKSAATASMWKAALAGGFEGFMVAAAAPWALGFWGAKKLAGTTPRAAYSGAGYLTGPLVTADDRNVANRIRYELNVRLPSYQITPAEWLKDAPWLYPQIKEQCVQLLKITTDLDVTEDELDRASRAFESVGEAVMDLPETMRQVYRQVTEVGTNIGQALLWVAGGLGALFVVGSLVVRR